MLSRTKATFGGCLAAILDSVKLVGYKSTAAEKIVLFFTIRKPKMNLVASFFFLCHF